MAAFTHTHTLQTIPCLTATTAAHRIIYLLLILLIAAAFRSYISRMLLLLLLRSVRHRRPQMHTQTADFSPVSASNSSVVSRLQTAKFVFDPIIFQCWLAAQRTPTARCEFSDKLSPIRSERVPGCRARCDRNNSISGATANTKHSKTIY